MNDLKIIKHNNVLMVDSRDVAEMLEIRHDNLISKIKGYVEILGVLKDKVAKGDKNYVDMANTMFEQTHENTHVSANNFFTESTYIDIQGKERPCFLLTKKGCDMVANKTTGEKGVLFTAAYVTKFEEMEKELTAPMQQLSPQLQLLISMELKQNEMQKAIKENKEAVQSIRDVVSLSTTSWRLDSSALIGKMAHGMGGSEHIRDLRKESYKLLDTRMGVCLEIRLTNKRRRMAEEGICKSKRDALNPLDVIAEDKKLIEGYVAIIKDMAIRYGV